MTNRERLRSSARELGPETEPLLTEKNTTEEESRIKTEEFLSVTNFHYK